MTIVPTSTASVLTLAKGASDSSDETEQGLVNLALAGVDALGDWFFWT